MSWVLSVELVRLEDDCVLRIANGAGLSPFLLGRAG